MECAAFLPTEEEAASYQSCIDHHIMHVLVKYLPFLQFLSDVVPEYIAHDHLEKSARKSEYRNIELLDANENESNGIITILRRIHELAIPSCIRDKKKYVEERLVFGGDVLTCERGLGAQYAMDNAETDFSQLRGVIFRPEGFHRVMNFVKVITSLITKLCCEFVLCSLLITLHFEPVLAVPLLSLF
jgi:hypothetical protein